MGIDSTLRSCVRTLRALSKGVGTGACVTEQRSSAKTSVELASRAHVAATNMLLL